MIGGTRLDRPSAVGDEGRPRATSLGIVTLLVAGYTVVVAEMLGLWGVVQPVASGVGLIIAGTALANRESTLAPFFGHLSFLPGGVVAVGGVATGFLAGLDAGLLATGLAVVFLGVGGAWADAVGRGTLSNALEGGLVSAAVFLAIIVTIPFLVGFAWLSWIILDPMLFPGRSPGLAGVCFLVAVAALAVHFALGRLPLARLVDRERRPPVERRLDGYRRAMAWLGVGSLIGWLIVGLLELWGVVRAEAALGPMTEILLGAGPRVGLALVTVAVLVAVALASAGRRLAGLDAASAHRYAPFVGGVGLVGIPVPALFTLLFVGTSSGSVGVVLLVALALVLVFVGALLVLFLLGVLVVAARAEVLPDRAAPLALVGAGLIGITVGGGIAGIAPPVTFLGVGLALFSWDVSEFGLGVTAELGHLPQTRRLEVFHAVASAGVALAGVALAATLFGLLGVVVPASFSLPSAMVVAVLGTLLLLPVLRG